MDDDNRRRFYALLIAAMTMVAVVAAAAAPVNSTTPTTNQRVDRTPTRNPTAPPPQAAWSKTYGGTSNDGASSVQQTSDGGYILAGEINSFGAGWYDFWLVKVDGSGNHQWNKTYGGTGNEAAYSVQQTSDGGYITAGYTDSFGAGMLDFWLVKTDDSGKQQWNKTYGGADTDAASSVRQTSDGGYIVSGRTLSFGAGLNDFWLVKTDESGNHQWSKTYGGNDDDCAWSVQRVSDGGYIVAGYTRSFGAGMLDFWLVKVDGSGNHQWNKTYGGTGTETAWSVQQTSDGGYIVAGQTDSFGASMFDFWLVKTDGNGNLQWSKTYGGTLDDGASSVQQTSDGGYITAGATYSFGAGGYDSWLVKVDSSGNHQWNMTYGGTSDDVAKSVQQTSDGGYIMAGSTLSFGAGLADFWLVKIGGTATWIAPGILVVIVVASVAMIGLAAILMRRWPRSP
nr:hypothetical protein [Candidatus Njordarchaeota archaeon]